MELLDKFIKQSKEILRDNLTGIYLHGSLVMGCYNPNKSDVDLIVVVKEEMSLSSKRELMKMVVELNQHAPAKGIEMSVVKKNVCNPFIYPTPYELHFSNGHLDWYLEDPEDYVLKMNGTDKDLAAHFTIIRNRGIAIYGLPIHEVFGIVPKKDYIDSIWFDVKNAKEDILENPLYVILNLTRVLAYLKEEKILSKEEGGKWGLANLPEEYHFLIQQALNEYKNSEEQAYDFKLAKKYAKYMLNEIKERGI